jgi:hypothetical protein
VAAVAIDAAEVVCEPFPIPGYFRRVYGIAIAEDYVAGVWLAYDAEHDRAFAYSEYCRSSTEHPAVHAQAIKARGDWPGRMIGPTELLGVYQSLGLRISPASNVETATQETVSRLSSKRLQVFRTCQKLIGELVKGLPGPILTAAICAVSGLAIAALPPRAQWDRSMIGLKPGPRHKAEYEPFRELYAGTEPPLRSDASPRR